MGMSLYTLGAGLGLSGFPAKTPGTLWRPESRRVTVGTDVAPITRTGFAVAGPRDITLARGDDVRFTSSEVFSAAKNAAMRGRTVRNFRSVDMDAFAAAMGEDREGHRMGEVSSVSVLHATRKNLVSYEDGVVSIRERNEDGTLSAAVRSFTVTQDTRIGFDGDGNAVVFTGSAARTNGVLAARGDDDILIRTGKTDVLAGRGTTVLNLSTESGTFGGGEGVTYLGAYTDSTFTGGAGTSIFAGYFSGSHFLTGDEAGSKFSGVFENSTVEGGAKASTFTGYFSGSVISGGGGANRYEGMFLSGSSVTGGNGDETFRGRFVDSSLFAGGGNDTIGLYTDLKKAERMLEKEGTGYAALGVDFLDSLVDAGDGDNEFRGVVVGGSVTMGDGNDTVSGVFTQAGVSAGGGNDFISALYADSSGFDTGSGSDTVFLATARSNTVTTGAGRGDITLGFNPDRRLTGAENEALGVGGGASATLWKTIDESLASLPGTQFGELLANTVSAIQGENVIRVRNGEGEQSAWVGAETPSGGTDSAPGVSSGTREENAFVSEASPESKGPGGGSGTAKSRSAATSEAQRLDLRAAFARNAALDARSVIEESPRSADDASGGVRAGQKRQAASRYARVYGAPPSHGTLAVNIVTGQGDDVRLDSVDRDPVQREPGGDWMHRLTRRRAENGYSYIASLL